MTYNGIFVRDQLGQQPNQPSAAWSASPDIILHGTTVETDLSQFTSAAGYAKDFGSTVELNKGNYIYLRGKNTNSTAQKAHIFLYHTQSNLALWPKNWVSDHITVIDQNQNWSLLEANTQGEVAVTTQPLIWTPPPPYSGTHYCLVSWSDNNSNTPTPPDLASLSKFTSLNQLIQFIHSHPNMCWRNTTDVYNTPPNYTYQTSLSFQDQGGTINLSISFIDFPLDSTFSVNLQGSDITNGITETGLKLSDYKGGFNVQGLNYPPNFATSVQVEWDKGMTNLTPPAHVKVSITQDATPLLLGMLAETIPYNEIQVQLFRPTYALPHIEPDAAYFQPTPVLLAGRQNWTMR